MSGLRFVVLTGAGISADSGLATFRGAGGLWEGRRVEDVATPRAWAEDPASVWRFYQERRAGLTDVLPNDAHRALVRLECGLTGSGHGFTLISQNVDDLHQRAGSQVLAMHGQLRRLRCEQCAAVIDDLSHTDPERYFPCARCGFERMRPDVVWFGEQPLHLAEIEQAMHGVDHFLSIGTSGAVYPAAGLLGAARAAGATTWVNSLDESDNLHADDEFFPGRAVDVVPALVDRWLALV